jgi:hypothetical protein
LVSLLGYKINHISLMGFDYHISPDFLKGELLQVNIFRFWDVEL